MSNSQRELAEAIERERAFLRANAIDIAMEQAGHIYRNLCAIDDPHAMHKAVEALPASVLAHILQEKLDGDLWKNPPEQINNRGPSPINVSMGYYARHSAFAKDAIQKMARAIMSGPIPTKSNPLETPINRQIETFINEYFKRQPGIDPGKTNFHLVRELFNAIHEDRGIREFAYKRGSGATTLVYHWIKWMQIKALVVDQSNGKQWKPIGADHRHFTESIRGLKPSFVVVDHHTFQNHSDIRERQFKRFLERLPFRGIWLQAYES